MSLLQTTTAQKEKGREIDESLATLQGEAAQQQVERVMVSQPFPVWKKVPSAPRAASDYYDLPMVKPSVWTWTVPLYFYTGGVAGGGGVLAAILEAKGGTPALLRLCRWLTLGGTVVSAALLTYDLGKPYRFLYMLRVFRPSSPMSWGSWALAETGAIATAAAVLPELGVARRLGRAATLALLTHGVFLSGYTGVLLSNSATPIWKHARFTLPFLFPASAVASTAALLEFFPHSRREESVVRRYGMVGKVAEAAGMWAMEQEVDRAPELSRPLREGKSGMLWKGAKACLIGGIIVTLLPGKSRIKRGVGGALTTVGALLLRYALMEAGKASALDPRATVLQKP